MGLIRTCIPASKIENDAYDWWKRHESKKSGAERTGQKPSFSVTPLPTSGQRKTISTTGKIPGMNFLPEKMY